MYNKKFKIYINLLCFFVSIIAQCTATCDVYNKNESWCSSVEDINQGGLKHKWEIVTITNSDEQVHPIKENTFLNIPNVRKLIFRGYFEINQNTFKGLEKLESIKLDLKAVNKDIFSGLTIKELAISSAEKIVPGCLDNLPNLTRMLLTGNLLSNIPAGVFNNTNMEILIVYENKIKTIEENAFYGMKNLKILAIDGNFLTTFDASSYFGESKSNLSVLYLPRNNITKLTKNSLKPFPNLRILVINQNNLESIEEETFYGMNKLIYIDISNNKLTNLSPMIFPYKGLQNVNLLFLHNNRFNYVSTETIAKLPVLSKISIGLNPWLCPCYEELKNFLHKKNITLVCVSEENEIECVPSKIGNSKCYPEGEDLKNVYEQFSDLTENQKHPPWCIVQRLYNDSYYAFNTNFQDYVEDLKYLLK